MPNKTNVEFAAEIAKGWAKNMTTAANGGPLDPLKDMFGDVCYIVLQNSDGKEVEFTLGDGSECTMAWDQFTDAAFRDLETQRYSSTTSNCLGVLGNRMILETGRLNKDGELPLPCWNSMKKAKLLDLNPLMPSIWTVLSKQWQTRSRPNNVM
jgi:hypothetical protein